MSRTTRQAYTGAKAVDRSCRNHGSCPWCHGNRTHKHRRAMKEHREQQL